MELIPIEGLCLLWVLLFFTAWVSYVLNFVQRVFPGISALPESVTVIDPIESSLETVRGQIVSLRQQQGCTRPTFSLKFHKLYRLTPPDLL